MLNVFQSFVDDLKTRGIAEVPLTVLSVFVKFSFHDSDERCMNFSGQRATLRSASRILSGADPLTRSTCLQGRVQSQCPSAL